MTESTELAPDMVRFSDLTVRVGVWTPTDGSARSPCLSIMRENGEQLLVLPMSPAVARVIAFALTDAVIEALTGTEPAVPLPNVAEAGHA